MEFLIVFSLSFGLSALSNYLLRRFRFREVLERAALDTGQWVPRQRSRRDDTASK